jgi:catechol 2,3-dioxygenase-like lactoylglutathione lyase family enzyme
MTTPSDLPPSILSHVSLGTNDLPRAKAFYDAVLATLHIGVVIEEPGAVAYGRAFPEFWVHLPHDGAKAAVGNGAHFGFFAGSADAVRAFHATALQMGGVCDGPPGLRPLYGPQYYGAFVRDLDGNKIEATFWDESASASSS